MAVSNISSGSDCGVYPKAEVQSQRGDDRSERVAGQSVELNGNRYQSRGVSSHSEPGCRTADKHKSQGEGHRKSKRRFHFSSSLTADMRSLLSPSLSAGISCYHDNERVPDVHDRIHDRKGNPEQIGTTNRCVIRQYIQGKKEASDVIAVTISVIKKSRTIEEAWEALTNVYYSSIPKDKISCFKKDPGSVNAFLRKLYDDCRDMSRLCECAKLTLELLVSRGVTCDLKTHNYLIKIHDKVRDIKGAECLLKRDQSSSSLTPDIRFNYDNERVPDVHDRKGNLGQITGRNAYVIMQYIGGKRKASNVIAATIDEINKSPTLEKAWEAVTNVYHPSIPEDKISCLKKDPGSVNAFLNNLYDNCRDMSRLCGFAKRALELLVSRGVTCNILTHTYLMKIYDKVSDIEGAECLLKRDNVVSENPEDWLGGDYHLGTITKYLQSCLQIKRYQEAGTLIDALIKLTDHAHAEPLRFIKRKCKNSHLVKVILEYCTAVGNFELAKKIFDPENYYYYRWNALRNQHVYNVFLSLCLELGEYKEAESIIVLLINNTKSFHVCDMNIWPNVYLVTNMLKYCICVKDYSLARLLTFGTDHQTSYISIWKIKSNESVYTSYIRVCLKTGKTQDIELVISELDKYARDENSDPSQRPTKDSCQAILEYCLETKNLGLAKELLFGVDGQVSLIRQWNIPYSILFFNLYLRVCTKAGEYEQACQEINKLISREKYALYKDLHSDVYTASAIFEFCTAAGNVNFVKKIVFSGKADRGCVDLRDVKINSICLADYISACAELRMFQEAKEIIDEIIKSAGCGQPYLSVCPDVNIAVAILKYCEQRGGDTDLADLMVFGNEKQQSYLSKLGIEPNFRVYAQWAVVHKNNFEQALDKLVENQICVNKLGYSAGVFDTHIDSVFEKKYCTFIGEEGKKLHRTPGLPSEFAEALFEYHYRGRGRNIKQVITGYHGTGALFDKFTDMLTKFKLETEVSAKGGCIVIKKTESETVKPED